MSDILGTIGDVIGVLDDLNARQSCVVSVINETAETLTMLSHDPAHGDFVTLPARTIAPGQTDTFGSADKKLSVLTGTESTVIYDVGGKAQWTVHYDNPGDLVESNGADAKLDPNTGEFTSEAEMAGGDAKVPVRFSLTGPGGKKGGGGTTPPVPPKPPGGDVDRRGSTLITVVNRTNALLTLFDQGHDHGEFVTVPPIEIQPGATASFSSFETEGATAEGSQGFATYSFGPTGTSTWTIRWNNPEQADNTTDSVLAGPDVVGIRGIDQIGAGEENVPATFTLTGQVATTPVVPPTPPVPPIPPTPPTPPDPPVPPTPPEPEPEFVPPVEVDEPTLRLHDQSVDGWVEYLQELLNGYDLGPLTVDGNFGPGTLRAVTAFQTARGLMVDGTVGNQTWAALREEAARPPSTDEREPHTFVEEGPEARWFTEDSALQYDPSQDVLFIVAVNTGNVALVPGQFQATARVTAPSGEQHTSSVDFVSDGSVPPGGNLFFGFSEVKARLGAGTVKVEAYLPAELGGDFTERDVEIV